MRSARLDRTVSPRTQPTGTGEQERAADGCSGETESGLTGTKRIVGTATAARVISAVTFVAFIPVEGAHAQCP